MVDRPDTIMEKRKRTDAQVAVSARIHICTRDHTNDVPGITGRPQGFPPSQSTASTTVAASDPHVAQLSKYPKPAGLADSIWAPSFVPTASSDTITPVQTANSGGTPLSTVQRPTWRPSGVTSSSRPTSSPFATLAVANHVDAITTKVSHPSQLPVSIEPLTKKTTIGLSVPANPPVTSAHPKETTGTHPTSREPDADVDDFEVIGHADAEEGFTAVSRKGPSASNGTS